MSLGWKDNYKHGDDKLDAQHQYLFDLARKLLAADDDADVKVLARQLYKHACVQFEDEEDRMRRHNYPGLGSHIASHQRLLGRLNTLSQDIGTGQLDKAALDALMTDWALFHMPLEDARFAGYLKPGH